MGAEAYHSERAGRLPAARLDATLPRRESRTDASANDSRRRALRIMKNSWLGRVLPVALGVVLGLGVCEAVVRLGSRVDEDGNWNFRGWRLPPYRLPVHRAQELARLYVTHADRVATYDPDLGWTVFPHSRSPNRMFQYNKDGIRTADWEQTIPPKPAPGVLRIALFGDSFTNGASAPFDQTWGHVLESGLRHRGIAAEVLNFGVGGYGMDQALLRWRKQGRDFAPNIVLFGFMPENVKRNLNLIRLLYVLDSRLPFTKPRFVPSGDTLRVVNSPAVPPESLADVVQNLERWPLRDAEAFYRARDYTPRLLFTSKFLVFALAVLGHRPGPEAGLDAEFGRAGTESGVVARRIVDAFDREAHAAGAEFYLVHLPPREALTALQAKPPRLWYAELLAAFERDHRCIETSGALLARARAVPMDSLYDRTSHYTVLGNRIVGEVVVESLARR
jgi:hypothetical protein